MAFNRSIPDACSTLAIEGIAWRQGEMIMSAAFDVSDFLHPLDMSAR
jgi:hypothetical protein